MFAQVTCAVDGEAVQRVFRLLRVSPADEVHKAHVPDQMLQKHTEGRVLSRTAAARAVRPSWAGQKGEE